MWKGKVLFKDGHVEETIEVLLFSEKDCLVTTASGVYRANRKGDIFKYYSEYLKLEHGINGGFSCNLDDCWLIDPKIESINIWAES